MKKKFFLSALLLAFTTLGVASCRGGTVPSDSAPSTTGEQNSNTSAYQFVDFVSKTKMKEDYKGKTFLKDGIGQVDLVRKIDGDTAHFYPHGEKTNLIKCRYNCIDTPESTGMLEPWGSGASNFNGDMLAAAKTIVLTTDSTDQGDKGSVPVLDSTGGRYLTYIWVSEKENADYQDLKLVNLALVQEGWSKMKGATGKDYASAFLNANQQAMDLEMHVWSPNPDPDFNYGAAQECTLKNIVEGTDVKGETFDWVGAKATFVATVAATGPDTGACYLNEDIDGKRYGIYVFTQYKVMAPLARVGNKIRISGTVARFGAVEDGETTEDEGTLQLVDAHYSAAYHEEGDIEVLEKGDGTYEEKKGTVGELAVKDNINVICSIDEPLTCYGGKAVKSTTSNIAYAFTLWCKNAAGEQINVRIDDGMAVYPGEKPGGENTKPRIQNIEYFKSATEIRVKGAMVTYYGRYQVKLCSRQGITVIGGDASKAY
ncbi:thermonuclease family protein [bacterium]|nr:thermonuclease family protein [bacterium]